jgi:hypothetical protein
VSFAVGRVVLDVGLGILIPFTLMCRPVDIVCSDAVIEVVIRDMSRCLRSGSASPTVRQSLCKGPAILLAHSVRETKLHCKLCGIGSSRLEAFSYVTRHVVALCWRRRLIRMLCWRRNLFFSRTIEAGHESCRDTIRASPTRKDRVKEVANLDNVLELFARLPYFRVTCSCG